MKDSLSSEFSGGARVLVVDDSSSTRKLIATVLTAKGCEPAQAPDGAAAIEMVRERPPDLILLDLEMPVLDGFATLERLKSNAVTRSIPVIVVTGLADRDSRLRALGEGADDYLVKPFDPTELWIRVRNHLRLKEYADRLADLNRNLQRTVDERTAELQSSYREAVYLLTGAAEHRDDTTGSHIRRIASYTALLATTMGLDDAFIEAISYASPMHDVGKIGIPDRILLKPGPLDPDERAIMESHTLIGARILGFGSTPYVRLGAEIALTHHECWDGSGYPNRLAGEQIPLSGRLLIVCDQYDALRSPRPYKEPLDHASAVRIIAEGDGRTRPEQFSPDVLAAFLRCHNEFDRIYTQGLER